jgi:7,8-dihydropterin-6-yl-methyl-4-(beta-D-ribofuranosyl)aminobenzene 5'-phosphate synthase
MAPLNLIELDSVSIQVIIDNELDPISASPNPAVTQTGGLRTIGLNGPDISSDPSRPGAAKEIRMDRLCCGAHGLALLITGVKGDERHTVLFDTGPEEHVFERNATRLGAKLGDVETLQLSHWHRDHSGGMLKAVSMIQAQKAASGNAGKVKVDLHPARPAYRGMQPPGFPVVSLEADPTFEAIEAAGGEVIKSDQTHVVGEGMFAVSGEIPRVTEYEPGLRFGVRYVEGKGWEKDEKMADERFMMCKIKGMLPLP